MVPGLKPIRGVMTADSPSPESPNTTPTPPPSGRDEAAALVRTIQMNAADKARSQQAPRAQKPRSPLLYVILVLAAFANAYVWIAKPEWLVGDASQLDSPSEREGVLRFRMYVQGQRIEAYLRENGVLPDRLEQTGPPFDGMRYQRTSPTSWELMGELDDAQLLLRSSESMTDFLAESQRPSEPAGQ